MRSALSLRLGSLMASGLVFCVIRGGLLSPCCCFCGSGLDGSCCDPARACSVVSPREALGCASGRAPSFDTSCGPITGGGVAGGGGGGGGGGAGGCAS